MFAKQLLSGSQNGRHIAVTSTAAPGVTLHVPPNIANIMDEVWLFANNNGSNTSTLFTQWGGSLSSDISQVVLSGTSGRTLVADGRVFAQSGSITAYVDSGTIIVDGFVNRLTPAVIDSRILDWAIRVVRNGGALPSLSTQLALSTFMQSLSQTGIITKMISMVCHVPDSLIAAITPLVTGPSFDPWTNHNFVSSDLTIHGLVGDGNPGGSTGTKYLDTGVIPGSTPMTSTNAGMTVYVYDDPRIIGGSGYAMGVGGAAFDSQFGLIPNSFSGGVSNTIGEIWRFDVSGQNVVVATPALSAGYMSINRTASNVLSLYFASSLSVHGLGGPIATTAQNGSIEPTWSVFAHAINVLAFSTITGFSNRRLSFCALHQGLTQADSLNFYNAIQTLRYNLGGGYV